MATSINKGKSLTAIAVSDHEAVGTVNLDELEHFGIKSPAEMAKIPLTKADRDDIPFKELRITVQRTWDKTRHGRADLYKNYLRHLNDGTIYGSAPPVTVYVNQPGKSHDGTIVFPYTALAIAIDGETQLEARFRLREELQETGENSFAVTIHHGISEEHAIQILHDYNRYAHPIPESKLGSKNSTGGMSQTIVDAIDQSIVMKTLNDLNRTGNTGTKKLKASYRQAMSFVTGYAIGPDALKRNATTWFDALNSPGVPPINGSCAPDLGEMFNLTATDQRVSLAAPIIWQVAGVLGSEGHKPQSLKWDDGFNTYQATAPKTLGKSRISDRLAALYAALK